MLGTKATVAREYTRELIRDFANGADVTLIGSGAACRAAPRRNSGRPRRRCRVAAEIAPCFIDEGGRRTDTIVLACTHYPLLLDRLERLSPMAGQLHRPGPGNRAACGRLDRRSRSLAPAPPGADHVHLAPKSSAGTAPRRWRVSELGHKHPRTLRSQRPPEGGENQWQRSSRRSGGLLQFKFTLPAANPVHIVDDAKGREAVLPGVRRRRVRLLQNVDDRRATCRNRIRDPRVYRDQPPSRGLRPPGPGLSADLADDAVPRAVEIDVYRRSNSPETSAG